MRARRMIALLLALFMTLLQPGIAEAFVAEDAAGEEAVVSAPADEDVEALTISLDEAEALDAEASQGDLTRPDGAPAAEDDAALEIAASPEGEAAPEEEADSEANEAGPDAMLPEGLTLAEEGEAPAEPNDAEANAPEEMPEAEANGSKGLAINEAHFPDDVFRAYVLEYCDGDSNGYLSNAEIKKVKEIDIFWTEMNLADAESLSGIEYFTALETLDCAYNKLTELDLSRNTALKQLSCQGNLLTALDLSHNTALELLDCSDNGLTSLDVNRNTALWKLMCDGNALTSLDLSRNTLLEELICYSCQLESLNISGCSALKTLKCSGNRLTRLDIGWNTRLQRLECDRNQLSELNLRGCTALYMLDCAHNALTRLDISDCPRLCWIYALDDTPWTEDSVTCYGGDWDTRLRVDSGVEIVTNDDSGSGVPIDEAHFPDGAFRGVVDSCDWNADGLLSKAEAAVVEEIDVGDLGIRSLAGIEYFTELSVLECNGNSLTSLDLRQNTKLTELRCEENQLTALDLSWNSELATLYCNDNKLTALKLAENTRLIDLCCRNNQLTSLDLKKNAQLRFLSCEGNRIKKLDITENKPLLNEIRDSRPTRYGTATSILLIPAQARDDCDGCFSFDATTTVTANNKTLYAPGRVDLNAKYALPAVSIGAWESSHIFVSEYEWVQRFVQSAKYYESSAPDIAWVDRTSGQVTGLKPGKATITLVTDYDCRATCKVTVKKAPGSVALSAKKLTLGVDEDAKLSVKYPTGTAGHGVEWSSTNEEIAYYSDRYNCLHAVGVGTATVTVETYNGKKASCQVTVVPAPEELRLQESEITLGVGQSHKMIHTLKPSNAAGAITYSSKNPLVASVSKDGTVKALRRGTAKIVAETYNGCEATLTVNVLSAPSKVRLSEKKKTLGAGETFRLQYALPSGSFDSVKFKSSKTSVATVDQQGLVTTKKAGKATITVTSYNGKKASCQVTVKKAPSSVRFEEPSLTLGVGQRYAPKVKLSKGAGGSLTLSSSREDVVRVEGNTLIAEAAGDVSVMATTYNGCTDICRVVVLPAPESIALSDDALTVRKGKSAQLTVTLPEGTAADWTFTTSNKKVATVSATGKVTGKKKGTATITVTTHNGVIAQCGVTVK